MTHFPLKPNSTYVKAYYAALKQLHDQGHITEGNTRAAFETLLRRCAAPYDWTVVPEYQFKGTAKQPLRADGALVDTLTLATDWYSGDDAIGFVTTGIACKLTRKLTILPAYQMGNHNLTRGNHSALLILAFTPQAKDKEAETR